MSISEELKWMRERCPRAYSSVSPKIYKGADGWGEYRGPYLKGIQAIAALETKELHLTDDGNYPIRAMEHEYIVANVLRRFDYPMFFVSPQLFEALNHTSITFTVEWATMLFPYDCFCVVLPPNSRKVNCFTATRAKASLPTHKPILSLLSYRTDGSTMLHNALTAFDPDQLDDLLTAQNADDDSKDETRWMYHLLFNILFAMAARPEYVESERQVGLHKKSGNAIYTPNVIGRRYATKRETALSLDVHISPRMHWRRGHFRQQAFGTGRSEHKIIWIEPVLVNAKVST